jgi:hypothetical protein
MAWMVPSAAEGYDHFVNTAATAKPTPFSRWARQQRALLDSVFEVWKAGFHSKIAVADWFDRENRSNAAFIQNLKNQVYWKLDRRSKIGWAGASIDDAALISEAGSLAVGSAFYSVVSFVAAGYVDTLRLGQGVLVEKSAGGVFKDALRLLSILPAGAMAGRLKMAMVGSRVRLMGQIPGQTGLEMVCTTNTAARAFAVSHGRVYSPVVEIWKAGGIVPPRDPVVQGVFIREIVPALQNLGAAVDLTGATTMAEVVKAAERNPNAAVMFSAYGSNYAHTMMASAIEGRVLIYETTGQVFRSWAEFGQAYANPTIAEMAIVHGSGVIEGAELAVKNSGLASALALQLHYRDLLTPILLKSAWDYTEKVALSGPLVKPRDAEKPRHEQQRTSTRPTTQPSTRIGGEPGGQVPEHTDSDIWRY